MDRIFIGEQDKQNIIKKYISNSTDEIKKIYVIGEPLDFELSVQNEHIKFSDVIMYKYFYRLLQEINHNSMIILNECLRKTNRYDLSYNCIKRYLLQTPHKIIFNYFPIIKQEKDFMILYDMIQNNPFLKEKYEYVIKFENVNVKKVDFIIHKKNIIIDDKYLDEYEKQKEKIILEVKKDPDIIPRRLLKFSEKVNKKYVKEFDSLSKIKKEMNVVVNQLKVDKYYYNELLNFRKELKNVIERIQK